MDVLVLGGTGLIGRALVPELLARGHAVTILSRGRSRPEWWDRVTHIAGERASFTLDRSYDAVIDNRAFTRADVEHSTRVLRGRAGRLIHTSTMGVYNYWEYPRPVREEDVRLDAPAHNDYARGKRDAEQALLDAAPGIPVTVFRPPVLEGAHDGTLRTWFWIRRILDGGPLLVPPAHVVRNLWTGDLAKAYVDALDRPGGVYNIAMAETLTGRQYVEAIAKAMGRPAHIVDAAMEGYEPPQFLPNVVDTGRIEREHGFRATPFADWMPRVVEWHLTQRLPDPEGYDLRAREQIATSD